METHLKATYGFNEFRDYQKEIISDLLNKENVFAILPTGGGKSLLYQYPATYVGKITIVVSPLISLMNDQCMFLNSKNIKSVCLNSEARIDMSTLGDCKLIYTTPEFITNRTIVLDGLKDKIGLFAIDEAHCVSQWSHDFRTSYLELGIIRKLYPEIPMLAVTATATPRVVDDMYDLLGVTEACEYNLGSRRSNLEISIHPKRFFDNCEFKEPTIIYVQTRKVCEELCEKLLVRGVKCAAYHGGMSKDDKKKSHDKFASGEATVIVATISFGMGIDKSDIRHVINYGVPNDIETYYQEIGRAGRDGLPSKASLYYNPGDFSTALFLIQQSEDPKQVALKTEAMNTFRKFLEENNMCRQQIIDYYFEKGSYPTEENVGHIPKCNMCDNCSGKKKQEMMDISEETKTIVKLINAQYFGKGFTYGMVKTVDMIKKDPRFQSRSKIWITELMEILITKNILKRVSKGSNFVICVAKKDGEIAGLLPIKARLNNDIGVNVTKKATVDKKLERLYEIRKTISCKHGILPTMFINDQVLMNIHNRKPKDVSQLWQVDGISDEFIVKYGSEFMTEYKAKAKKKPSTSKSGGVKDITYKHYKEGKSMSEISKLTDRTIRVIEDHMIHIFEHYDGVVIDRDYFGLTPEFEEEIKNAVKKVGSEFLKPIKDIVNNKITYGQIKLYLLISRLE